MIHVVVLVNKVGTALPSSMVFFKRSVFSCCLALTAGACLAGCDDKGASLNGVSRALAVGAYHSLSYGDACSGVGRINFCTSQKITEVLELRSEDPSIVEVVPAANHPRADKASKPHYVLGKRPGKTSLTFKGAFDDGTVRADSTVIEVKRADRGQLSFWCSGENTTNLLVHLGETESFELELFAGSEKLAGWLPGATETEGLGADFGDDATWYTWQAPSVPTVTKLQPGTLPTVVGTLTAFGPAQVTAIDVASVNNDRVSYISLGGSFSVHTHVLVNGQRSCRNVLPVELHSTTPSVCSGPAGETVWMGDEYGGAATIHAEGTCGLGVSMPGARVLASKSFAIFNVQAPPADLDLPGFRNSCPVEGGTACAHGYGMIGVCKDGRWAEKTTCPTEQTCDFIPNTTPGCASGASCAACRGLR